MRKFAQLFPSIVSSRAGRIIAVIALLAALSFVAERIYHGSADDASYALIAPEGAHEVQKAYSCITPRPPGFLLGYKLEETPPAKQFIHRTIDLNRKLGFELIQVGDTAPDQTPEISGWRTTSANDPTSPALQVHTWKGYWRNPRGTILQYRIYSWGHRDLMQVYAEFFQKSEKKYNFGSPPSAPVWRD